MTKFNPSIKESPNLIGELYDIEEYHVLLDFRELHKVPLFFRKPQLFQKQLANPVYLRILCYITTFYIIIQLLFGLS